MKREPMTFAVCSAAVVVGAMVSFFAVMCLVKAFDLLCQPIPLMITCCLTAGVAVGTMELKRSWIAGLCVLVGYLAVLLWQSATIKEEVLEVLYRVSSEYSRCFRINVIGAPGGQVQWLMSMLAIPLAWLCVWTICREGHAAFVILACAPIFVLCLLVVDLTPVFCLVMLTAALLLLILTSSVRLHSASEGARLLWWLAAPVMTVFFLLMALSPVQEYERSDWSESLQALAEEEVDFEILEKQVTTAIRAVWNGDLKKVDLGRVGPKQKTGAYVLSYESSRQIRYLRGVSLGIYEQNTWNNVELPYSYTTEQTQLVRQSDAADTLHLRTAVAEPMLYTAYYPSAVPNGLAVDDAYWKNGEREKQYSVTFDPESAAAVSPEYEAFVLKTYTQLPQSLQEPLAQILYEAGLVGCGASEIGAFVQNSGVYDLNTPSVPAGEDFALYFLTQSHQGYCVHFATATTLLLRSAGIPARYVTGYAVSGAVESWNQVTEDQAHAWVEYYEPGVGWQVLDPTPASYREPEPEVTTQPESVTEPEPVPEQPPEDSTKPETSVPVMTEENNRGIRCLWLLPCLLVLVPVRRWIILYCRRTRMRGGHPNRRTLDLWNWLVRLHKADGTAVLEQWICLAEKAKFSQHTVSEEELAAMEEAVSAQIAQLKKRSFLRRLWCRYGLVLY